MENCRICKDVDELVSNKKLLHDCFQYCDSEKAENLKKVISDVVEDHISRTNGIVALFGILMDTIRAANKDANQSFGILMHTNRAAKHQYAANKEVEQVRNAVGQ